MAKSGFERNRSNDGTGTGGRHERVDDAQATDTGYIGRHRAESWRGGPVGGQSGRGAGSGESGWSSNR